MNTYKQLHDSIVTCGDWVKAINDESNDVIDFLGVLASHYYNGKTFKKLGNIGWKSDWQWEAKGTASTPKWDGANIKRTSEFGYWESYDKYDASDIICTTAFEYLEMSKHQSIVNLQKPNQITRLHYDTLDSFFDSFQEYMDHPFDLEKLQPKGTKPVRRFFVALSDWTPGMMFQMGTDHWSGWKAGDVVEFFWPYNLHSTANASFEERPLLKITGYTDKF